jgi:diadenosine tetraphosphatase ApaH/serine/threonine PP2A family protein phosphatase
VRGNHDEGASGNSSLDELNPLAYAALMWTREQLSEEQRQWMKDLKLVRQVRDFTIVHATLDSPLSWGYIRAAHDAAMSLACQSTPVCFIGHTHVPKAFAKGNGEILLFGNEGEGVQLPMDQKLLINAGSVGQSRDGDPRAAYMIYDEESSGLWLRRVEYDIEAASAAVRAAGLPERLAERLHTGS